MLAKRVEHSVLSISTSFKLLKPILKTPQNSFARVKSLPILYIKNQKLKSKSDAKIPKKTDRVYMGMGLYGGEKIKRLTRERESGFLRIIVITNS
ncbi:hypothetical protein ckin65_08320 [Helicobacter pylori]